MPMDSILVTGATGFIGQYVVKALLERGYPVIATSVNDQKARQQSWYNHVKYIAFDLADFDPEINYFSFFDQPGKVLHLAWEGLPNYKSDFHVKVNLPRHFAFLKNMATNGMKDLTVTGTCLEYGMQEGMLSEDRPPQPANCYAIAKDTLRNSLQDISASTPFIFKWVRLFYMFGKGQNPASLFSQLDKALEEGQSIFNMSGGEQVRDYLPVEEVASNIVKIALQKEVTGVINCSSSQPVTVKTMVKNYLTEKNKNISLNLGYYPYPDYEPMVFWGDNSKLKTVINTNF